jgi:transposase InsO family protein
VKFTGEQRLLILDTWRKSGLGAPDFSALVGVSAHTLYEWKRRFEREGPAGLMDRPRGGPRGSRLPDLTKRAILMIKEANPEYGCQRISDMLARGPALPASANTVARVLREAGYELQEVRTHPHREQVRRFERSKAGALWQSDIFTFVLKRQNRRVYMIAFLDDHSRFLVGYGLYGSATTALVLEVLASAIASYGPPEEILTDNGPQYVTWRGRSAFAKDLQKRGIKHLVARPKRPQTLGKMERAWGTLWRECLEAAVFVDLEDARRRVGLFWDHYNFFRTHQGIGGLVPADRFFGAAPEVLKTMKERVTKNALHLARHGLPKEPFYVTGQVGGKAFSVHAEGERVILTKEGRQRQEVELVAPQDEDAGQDDPPPVPVTVGGTLGVLDDADGQPPPPGVSPLDEGLRRLADSLGQTPQPQETDLDDGQGGGQR